jgi:hypothetical protein
MGVPHIRRTKEKKTMGALNILNVYEGDVEITYNTNDAAEAIRARRIITDMMRRGYSMLIEVDGAYQRAVDFDEKVGKYIIADFDPTYRQPRPQEKEGPTNGEEHEEIEAEASAPPPKKRDRPGRRSISMADTTAVAIAPSAGG